MSPSADFVWSNLVSPTLNAFALAGSLIGVVIGVGLLLAAKDTVGFFRRMNRRVSMRRTARPLEIPRDIEGTPGRRMPLVGVAYLLGGAYSAVVLFTQLDAARAVQVLGVKENPITFEVLLNALRWFLIVGGLAAVVFGAMLLFAPQAWRALEVRANRWYSTRQLMRGGDEYHEGLDRLVEAFPRAAGVVLCATSMVASVAFAILLFR